MEKNEYNHDYTGRQDLLMSCMWSEGKGEFRLEHLGR